MIYFCSTCGDMKFITYKYISGDLHIICECKKENKKNSYILESFLKINYKSNPKLKCVSHYLSFSHWCINCYTNICEKCLIMHKNHQIIKLASLLINNNDFTTLRNNVVNYQKKLHEKKKKIDEKKMFNQKEELQFLNNFNKYYKFNCYQIAFVQRIKDLYSFLIQNNNICYQIIQNLKYLIGKLNLKFIEENKNINQNMNNDETNDIIYLYYMVFNSQQYCLLQNNEKEEMEKEAEEKQKEILLERSIAISELSDFNDNFTLMDIPLSETIKLDDNIIKTKSLQAVNNQFVNPFINDNNKNNNNENKDYSLIDSDTESNFGILDNQVFSVYNKNQPKENERYYGLLKNGKYHGDKCILFYPNGFKYEGSFREGLRHGYGKLTNESSGYSYQGNWSYDKKNGKCVEIINGEKFEGIYKNGVREGKCVITYSNKDKFVGNLIDGKKDGYGEQFFYKTNTTYKGEFRNNLYEGKGEIINNNGYYFKGEFLGGLRHGDKCIETKKGFKKYEGQFRRDKMNGKGVFEWYSGESKGDIYNGEFKDDLFEGFGTYKYNDGSIYMGEFLHGVKHGKGKEIYIDGSFYEGEYNEGQQSGKGLYQDFEGNIYEGNFYNGNKNSKGKITYVNGEILEGLWLNGLKEGNFYFTDSQGYKFFRKYVKDELIEEKKEGFFSSFFTGVFDKISSFTK